MRKVLGCRNSVVNIYYHMYIMYVTSTSGGINLDCGNCQRARVLENSQDAVVFVV